MTLSMVARSRERQTQGKATDSLTSDKNELGHGAFNTAQAGREWLIIPSECLLITRVSQWKVFIQDVYMTNH